MNGNSGTFFQQGGKLWQVRTKNEKTIVKRRSNQKLKMPPPPPPPPMPGNGGGPPPPPPPGGLANTSGFKIVPGLGDALHEMKRRISGVEETPACAEGKVQKKILET